MILSLQGCVNENAERYAHIAVSGGEHPDSLKRAVDFYKSAHLTEQKQWFYIRKEKIYVWYFNH